MLHICESVTYKINFLKKTTADGSSEEAKAVEEGAEKVKAAEARTALKEAEEAEERAALAADRLKTAEEELEAKKRAAQARLWEKDLNFVLVHFFASTGQNRLI